VLKKWKNLRTHYGDEKRKINASKSGMGSDEMYETKWRWYSMMKFMEDYVGMKAKTTLSNLMLQVISCILFHCWKVWPGLLCYIYYFVMYACCSGALI